MSSLGQIGEKLIKNYSGNTLPSIQLKSIFAAL